MIKTGFTLLCVLLCASALQAGDKKTIRLERLGSYKNVPFALDRGAAEIVAFDPQTKRVFFINGDKNTLDVLDIANLANPMLTMSLSLAPHGRPTSVDVKHGLVAVSVENGQLPGNVVFFNTNGGFLRAIQVGALPDMITFTPNGKYVLTANEGEPSTDYTVDPEGSVTIIRLRQDRDDDYKEVDDDDDDKKGKDYDVSRIKPSDVVTARFTGFTKANLDPRIRIFGPNATVAQDLEPEYIAVSKDSRTAWVTLQENNAIAELDIEKGKFVRLAALGFKNHNTTANKLDASNGDNAIDIRNWPLLGMYQPDGIAAFKADGRTYLITANEGDVRGWDAFNEETTVGALLLDATAFPDQTIKQTQKIGNLKVTSTLGKVDPACTTNCVYNKLYSFGGRSFSIWRPDGTLVFDSGDDIEQKTALALPNNFNANHNGNNNNRDNRSDDKGPEPEGVIVAEIKGKTYAFIGLERISGIMVYDISNPQRPEFVQYFNDRNFAVAPNQATGAQAGDLGPEGLKFISAKQSPIGEPLLIVGNEVSGSVGILKIVIEKEK